MYKIMKRNYDGTFVQVGSAKTKEGARRAVDRRDNAHGSYVHSIRNANNERVM